LAWLPEEKSSDDRSSVSRDRLQSAITEAVKKADPDCEGFVGVIVQRESPKGRLDANWAVKGVKFGKADGDKSSKALATIVERMQREFVLAPHVPKSHRPGDSIRRPGMRWRRSVGLIEPAPFGLTSGLPRVVAGLSGFLCVSYPGSGWPW
jgi:hypothetical protein